MDEEDEDGPVDEEDEEDEEDRPVEEEDEEAVDDPVDDSAVDTVDDPLDAPVEDPVDDDENDPVDEDDSAVTFVMEQPSPIRLSFSTTGPTSDTARPESVAPLPNVTPPLPYMLPRILAVVKTIVPSPTIHVTLHPLAESELISRTDDPAANVTDVSDLNTQPGIGDP